MQLVMKLMWAAFIFNIIWENDKDDKTVKEVGDKVIKC